MEISLIELVLSCDDGGPLGCHDLVAMAPLVTLILGQEF